MRLLIDTNILLDVLQIREPYFVEALRLWGYCEERLIEGYISAVSLTNIAYVMRKELTPDRMQEIFMALAITFRIADLSLSDLEKAADMKWRDFEDAVQSATASRINADYIITRNAKDFEGNGVRAVTPEEYFAEIFTV